MRPSASLGNFQWFLLDDLSIFAAIFDTIFLQANPGGKKPGAWLEFYGKAFSSLIPTWNPVKGTIFAAYSVKLSYNFTLAHY
jgi:hypothetical protein